MPRVLPSIKQTRRQLRVLILGVSGMLGNTLLRYLAPQADVEVRGTSRTTDSVRNLPEAIRSSIKPNFDVQATDQFLKLFADFRPDVVINCVGVVKQLTEVEDPLTVIQINSLLAHRVAKLCDLVGARFIHFSTDCVFSGSKGMYTETDLPDAYDLYGRSKLMGEVNYPNTITFRTSLIGHELTSSHSLLSWFLSQSGRIRGFRRVFFSGLPAVEIARILHKFVLPNSNLNGLYHLSGEPINKFDLLSLVAEVYEKRIKIVPDDSIVINRSLDSSRFREVTGFSPKPWPELVQAMHDFQ